MFAPNAACTSIDCRIYYLLSHAFWRERKQARNYFGTGRDRLMKALKCDLCDVTAEGETFEDWMTALRPHYMEAHAEVMNDPDRPLAKEDMEKWMADNKARFDSV